VEDLEGKEYLDLYTPVSGTNIHMGGPGKYKVQKPPTSKDEKVGSAEIEATFYVHTKGTAAFVIGGEWWENVGSNKLVYVGGAATIDYKGVHTLKCESASNEFYMATRLTQVAGDRTDKLGGSLTQTVASGGKQDVTGAWTHKVSALAHDDYGTWQTDTKSWTGTFGPGTTISAAAGEITIKSPVIKLNAPSVTVEGAAVEVKAGFWKGVSSPSLSVFTSTNQVGIQSFTGTAINIAANGVNASYNALQLQMTGVNLQTTGLNITQAGVTSNDEGVKLMKGALTLRTFGMCLLTCGFKKM
jgi:type VI secretion system secreted protein VgrG